MGTRAQTRYSVRRTGVELLDRNFDAIALALRESVDQAQPGIKSVSVGPTIGYGRDVAFLNTATVTWSLSKTSSLDVSDVLSATVIAGGGGPPVGGFNGAAGVHRRRGLGRDRSSTIWRALQRGRRCSPTESMRSA